MVKRVLLKKKKQVIDKIGQPPGTLLYTGDDKKEEVKVKIIDYNDASHSISEYKSLPDNFEKIEPNITRWISIKGIKQVDLIEKLGNGFDIHPLVLEDIVNPNQRPKYEDYSNFIFIILKRLMWDDIEEDFSSEQISLILGYNYVITLEEKDSDLFVPIIDRIQSQKGRVHIMGADYLLYALLDVVIDNYFIVQEIIGEFIEQIEDALISEPKLEILQSIYRLKRQSIEIRKSIWPLRAVINSLQREESNLIGDSMQIYLRDIYDHIFRINDSLENYRDIISGMLDLYLSSVSNRMNEIMKVLTIISTIFIPLSFLAGFYGMNFIYMPEVQSPIGYPLLIVVMVLISIVMIYYFKRKKWF